MTVGSPALRNGSQTTMNADEARATASHAPVQTTARTTAEPGLVLVTACPRCSAAVPSESSDFCESCSAHLYPGHCVFCLEAFSPGQVYCRRCGLPPEGVVCGSCGTFSRFDFCPNPDCGAGLTPRAAAELARLEEDPEVIDAFEALDEIGELLAAVESGAPIQPSADPVGPAPRAAAIDAAQVSRELVAQAVLPTPAARVAATPPRPSLAALRAAATNARSAEEKARVRELAQQAAQESMNAVSSRPFPTAQEARAAGTALQVALRCRVVTERLETIAWRCNRFSCEHPEPGGMSLCSDPSGGGVPIMRVITQVDDRSAEFTA